MATLGIPPGGLSLRGWPRQPFKDSSDESASKRTAILLQANQRVIRELQQCSSTGEKVRLLCGRSPSIQYGSKTISLQIAPETYTHELYSKQRHDLMFTTPITHRATLASSTNAGRTDAALANLKHSLASFEQSKEANSPKVQVPGFRKRITSVYQANSNNAQVALDSAMPADHFAAAQSKAIAYSLSHLLSSRPLSEEQIIRQTHIPRSRLTPLLERLADLDEKTQAWHMRDKSYKDLDIWKFGYPKEQDREAAIDNAIRAFDRMRLSKDDKLWQLLLPQKERGRGKCLSRLHLGTAQAPGNRGATSPLAMSGFRSGRATPLQSTPMIRTATPTQKHKAFEKRIRDSQKQRALEEIVTGRKTAPLKARPATLSKFKSSETVHSSDESSSEMGVPAVTQKKDMGAARADAHGSPGTSSSDNMPAPAMRTGGPKSLSKPPVYTDGTPFETDVPPRPESINHPDFGKRKPPAAASNGVFIKSNATGTSQTSDGRPRAASGASHSRTSSGSGTEGGKPKTPSPAGTPAGLFGGYEKPQPVVRKMMGGRTTPLSSGSGTEGGKPKTPSPARTPAGMFGGHEKPQPVVRKMMGGRTTPLTVGPASLPGPPKRESPPKIFGSFEPRQPVVKKYTSGAAGNGVKATSTTTSHGSKSTSTTTGNGVKAPSTATGNGVKATPTPTSNGIKKRPADGPIESDGARKVAKVNTIPATARSSAQTKGRPAASAPEPKTSVKRKSDEMSPSTDHEAIKHRRTESGSTQSITTNNYSSGNSHTTTARTSVASPSPQRHEPWMGRSTSTTPSSENGKASWERALLDAERFRGELFPRYQALYDKIAATKEEDVRREEREELWKMHVELKEMKRVLRDVASA